MPWQPIPCWQQPYGAAAPPPSRHPYQHLQHNWFLWFSFDRLSLLTQALLPSSSLSSLMLTAAAPWRRGCTRVAAARAFLARTAALASKSLLSSLSMLASLASESCKGACLPPADGGSWKSKSEPDSSSALPFLLKLLVMDIHRLRV